MVLSDSLKLLGLCLQGNGSKSFLLLPVNSHAVTKAYHNIRLRHVVISKISNAKKGPSTTF